MPQNNGSLFSMTSAPIRSGLFVFMNIRSENECKLIVGHLLFQENGCIVTWTDKKGVLLYEIQNGS